MESTMLGNTTSMVLSTCLIRQAALFKRGTSARTRTFMLGIHILIEILLHFTDIF